MQISTEIIDSIVKKNGSYYVPDNIKTGIENCFENDDENEITQEYLRLFKLFQDYEKVNAPIPVEYNGAVTLDAYTAYYLCRNLFIPSIALRDLAIHERFQDLPMELNVLDIGSGTGAVTLGLLSMFNENPLSEISIKITAVDCCVEALNRQKNIISEAGFDLEKVKYHSIDINDEDCLGILRGDDPYNLIFIANCLTEISRENAFVLVSQLTDILDANGALIIAEAQRNYTKAMIRYLVRNIRSLGLNVYYPCASDGCPYSPWCWVWRYHEYGIPDIQVNGKYLQGETKPLLTAIWLILTKQAISIYDPFRNGRSDLLWGPVSKETGEDRAICCGGTFKDKHFFPLYRRGHIVGLSEENEVMAHYKI